MARRSTKPQPPKPTTPEPSADYIMDIWRLKLGEADEARLIRLAWEFRRLTRMTHELRIPDAYKTIAKEVRTPFVRDTWHRAVAALNQKPYVIHIEPRDGKQDTERAAEIGQRWDMAMRESLDKEILLDTAVESAKALIRDGESVLKVVHRPDSWANYPIRERGENADDYLKRGEMYKKGAPPPFAWRVVDRLTTIWQDGEFGDEWVIELAEYPRPFLGRRYGMMEFHDIAGDDGRLVDPEHRLGGMPKPYGWLNTPFGHSVKAEYWDQEWWAVVIDGTMAPGFPRPNPYAPRLPYFRAKGPDSESLLYSLLFLAPALDEVLTMKLNWAHLAAYPSPVVHALPNTLTGAFPLGEDGTPPALVWKPGKALTFPAGWTIDFLQPPPAGQDLNQLVTIMQALIDIAGIPSVFRGVGGSDQAGYAINQLMAAASLAFRLASESMSRQFARAFEFLHWMVPNVIGQPVYTLAGPSRDGSGKQWLALKPEGNVTASEASVGDLGPVNIEFRATLPTDEQARAMIAMQLVNAPKPLLSRRRAMTDYLQIENPEEVLDEMAVEEALESDPLRSIWIEKAVQDAGLETPQAPQGEPGQQGGPPGAPPVPGGPSVPGLNMPMQPAPPNAPSVQVGGRAPGAFPGQPPNAPTPAQPAAAGGA